MATTTSNLSLRKPESSDYVSVSLDIAGNMQTIDDKWASSAAANIGSAAAAGSALTVARTDHVHTVGSGTVSAPGLPVGESNTGLYRPGTGQLAATVAGALSWITSATGIALETAISFKHIATPSAAATGYLKLYAKSDNKLYKQTPGGDEVLMLDTDLFTTAGDLVYFSADETPARLAAGTSSQVLIGGTTPAFGSVSTSMIAANAVTQITSATGTTSGPTRSTGTYADLEEMSCTLTTTGGPLLVIFDGTFSNITAGAGVAVALSLDGAAEVHARSPNSAIADNRVIVSIAHLFTGVSASSHTVKVRWLVAAGTGTAFGTQRDLVMMELKK